MKLKDVAYRTVPGIEWLNRYTLKDWVADVIAGVTVALTVLPQGLAYATLAGLEPQVSALEKFKFFFHQFLRIQYSMAYIQHLWEV